MNFEIWVSRTFFSINDVTLSQRLSGTINYLECCICSWFSGNNIAAKKVPEYSFSGTFSGHDQLKPYKEAS
jgi:hypothetical protein